MGGRIPIGPCKEKTRGSKGITKKPVSSWVEMLRRVKRGSNGLTCQSGVVLAAG